MSTSEIITPVFNDKDRRVASAVERARTGAHSVIDKVTGAAHPAMDRIASGAHRTVERATGAATHTATVFNEKREQLRYARLRAMGQTRDYVRANPVLSLGIAVAAGYLLATVLRTRKHRTNEF